MRASILLLSGVLMAGAASAQQPAQPPAPAPYQPPAKNQTPPAAAGENIPPPVPAIETEAAPKVPTDAVVLSAIANLAPMIGDVQILGPWTQGDRHGIWRSVMTQPIAETTGNRFFVQQIEEKSGNSTVIASTEITEIASIEGAVVGYRADPPAAGQENNLTIFFDIVPLDGEITESYELFFAPGEPYRFGPASN
ncbi:hypothetical protein [Aureimonas sp. AU4]|uniref:hypothetical protein n=1 Tax=Aureimonas sp. AU4 TaxID=1638163 RepID=UPI0007063E52|nr:hypothetical protein [Aureimonas sp. AU4]BAT30688.1 DNA topoisomerase IV subunit B [Aureimonas sp. AU4]